MSRHDDKAGRDDDRRAHDREYVPIPVRTLDYVDDGGRIEDHGDGTYLVEGSTGAEYAVDLRRDRHTCTCRGWKRTWRDCKHVRKVLKRLDEGGPVASSRSVLALPRKRPSYPQVWPNYKAAREAMGEAVPIVLRAACDAIALRRPASKKRPAGRPALSTFDAVKCVCLTRVMHTQSGGLAASEVRGLWERRWLASPRPPSANAISSAMRGDALPAMLDEIVDLLAAQLKSRETRFAADRTTYEAPNSRYFLVVADGKRRLRRIAREVHLDCVVGVETGIVSAAMVNDDSTGESQFLVPNLERTNRCFRIDEVKADAGYGSEDNREYVVGRIGARFFCPYKRSEKEHGVDGEWDRQMRDFKSGGDAWDRSYHERSNIEACFSSDKRVHRRRVLSRTLEAQRSEILAHCVVQDARVLIAQFFLGDLEIAFLDSFSHRHLEDLRERLMPESQACPA